MKRVLLTLFAIIILMTPITSFAGVCGDVNADGKLNLLDISYIINYLYRSGSAPNCGPAYIGVCGDVNADGKLNLLDISYIINYLYRGGQEPFCGPLTDIDGNVYKTVKIGDQWWMAENLKVTRYQNGDAIPNVTNDSEWHAFSTGAYCDYGNDPNNSAIYGRLYNGYVVLDGRNIAPEGWHVPSDAEWKQLEMYLGMSQTGADATGWLRGTDEGGKLKEAGMAHWQSPNTGATDESGFTALPGGYRWWSGSYADINIDATYWTSTQNYDLNIWYRTVRYDHSDILRFLAREQCGVSVRCVKNANTVPVLTTSAISEITETTAQCGGTITSDGGAIVTARGICWSTNPTPTVADNKTTAGTGIGNFTSSIAGLTARTTYFVRAYATNRVGTGYGNVESFTTWSSSGIVTDIDGNVYQTIPIGTQVWMSENLKVTHYRNGDAIPNVTDGATWGSLMTGAYAEYNNDVNTVTTYGRLYNWHAVVDSRQIAPAGWHIPSDAEWKQLEMYLGMNQTEADAEGMRGTDEGGKLKESGTIHWTSPNVGATNESNFTALPGGYRADNGTYYGLCNYADFWSSTESNDYAAWSRSLNCDYSVIYRTGSNKKLYGFSIRCVKDAENSPVLTAISEKLPAMLSLTQNYPNPFNPVTTISYSLPTASQVKLDIYNILGQKIATLVNEKQEAGEHSICWDGGRFSSGVYFYRLIADQATETKKMLLLK